MKQMVIDDSCSSQFYAVNKANAYANLKSLYVTRQVCMPTDFGQQASELRRVHENQCKANSRQVSDCDGNLNILDLI
jgi:hypothetical protein